MINSKNAEFTQHTMMETNSDLYEQFIVNRLTYDRAFWDTVSPYVCWDASRKIFVNDFDNPYHFALFMAIRAWRNFCNEANLDIVTPCPSNVVFVQLDTLSKQAQPCVLPESVAQVMKEYEYILKYDPDLASNVIGDSWQYWLDNKQVKNVMQDSVRSGTYDVLKSMQTLEAITNRSILTTKEASSFSINLSGETDLVERIPIPGAKFKRFNDSLGGGFGKKEHTLIIAPTGGGKTVFATQVAGLIASAGIHKVLFISTEQCHQELIPRIVSNLCDIPFQQIKDGKYNSLTESELLRLKDLENALSNNLFFIDWAGTGHSVKDQLAKSIREHQVDHKVDMVILDWIGGALAGATYDSQVRRLLMKEAASVMKDVAIQLNVATLSLAQAVPTAAGKTVLGTEDIAECKSLGDEATVVVGISAIRAPKSADITETGVATFTKNQNISFIKSRKAAGKIYQIERNFEFQRFGTL